MCFAHCLNHQLPYTKTGKPPLIAFPQAKHSGRYFNPLTENTVFDEQLIKNYLYRKEWFRKVSDIKTVSIGGHIYRLKKCQNQN